MHAVVSGASFSAAVSSLLQGQSTLPINLCLRNKYLILQSSGIIIEEIPLLTIRAESDEYNDVTIEATHILELATAAEVQISYYGVTKDAAATQLSELRDLASESTHVLSGVVTIIAGNFSYTASVIQSRRVELEYNIDTLQDLKKGEFQAAITGATALDNVAKSIHTDPAILQIFEGKLYVVYENAAYVNNISLPNMAITSGVAKKLLRKIDGGEVFKYSFDEAKQCLYFVGSAGTIMAVFVQRLKLTEIEAIKSFIAASKEISTFNLSEYGEHIDCIVKAYSKGKVTVSFTENGLHLFVSNPKNNFGTGDDGEPLLSTILTTVQLGTLNRVFKGAHDVQLRGGNRYICLQQGAKHLLVVGMSF